MKDIYWNSLYGIYTTLYIVFDWRISYVITPLHVHAPINVIQRYYACAQNKTKRRDNLFEIQRVHFHSMTAWEVVEC